MTTIYLLIYIFMYTAVTLLWNPVECLEKYKQLHVTMLGEFHSPLRNFITQLRSRTVGCDDSLLQIYPDHRLQFTDQPYYE